MATDQLKGKGKKAKASEPVAARKSSRISDQQAAKRKATEEASPIAAKKRKPEDEAAIAKPVKKAVSEKTKQPVKAKKPAKKGKKGEAETQPEEPEEKPEEEEEEDEDDSTKALVQDLDGDEDDETPGGASLFQPGQDVGKAPVPAAKALKASGKAAAAANSKEARDSEANLADQPPVAGAVVYIGRIPHGFFEHEMRSYFSQFGDIRRLRLSRNRRTGASKHYAFVEFADPDVAAIVAQTMDNYLLFGHLLRCSIVPAERFAPTLFKGANRRFKAVPWNRMAGRQLAKPLPAERWSHKIVKETTRRSKRAAQLEKTLGYTYAAPALKSVDAAPDAEAEALLEAGPASTDEAADEAVAKAIETVKETEVKVAEAKEAEEVKEVEAKEAQATEEAKEDTVAAAPAAETKTGKAKGKKSKGKKSKA